MKYSAAFVLLLFSITSCTSRNEEFRTADPYGGLQEQEMRETEPFIDEGYYDYNDSYDDSANYDYEWYDLD